MEIAYWPAWLAFAGTGVAVCAALAARDLIRGR